VDVRDQALCGLGYPLGDKEVVCRLYARHGFGFSLPVKALQR